MTVTTGKINEIYGRILHGRVSLDAGIREILVYIYTHPQIFGLAHVESDLKNTVMLQLVECLPKCVANYSKSKAFFSTYVTAIILNMVKKEYGKLYRQQAHEASVVRYVRENEHTYTPDFDDGYAQTAEDSGFYGQPRLYTASDVRTKRNFKKLKPIHMLILALKSCHYLNDMHIRHLAHFTGCTAEEIFDYKQKLEAGMQKRLKRYKDNQYRLNNSYMLKNRCFLQLMSLPPDSPLIHRVMKHYDHYTQNWKKRIQRLRAAGMLRPTNDEIARVLNMQTHQVYSALRYIRSLKP